MDIFELEDFFLKKYNWVVNRDIDGKPSRYISKLVNGEKSVIFFSKFTKGKKYSIFVAKSSNYTYGVHYEDFSSLKEAKEYMFKKNIKEIRKIKNLQDIIKELKSLKIRKKL